MPLKLNLRVSASARAQLSSILTCAHHMEEVTCKLLRFKGFSLEMTGHLGKEFKSQ